MTNKIIIFLLCLILSFTIFTDIVSAEYITYSYSTIDPNSLPSIPDNGNTYYTIYEVPHLTEAVRLITYSSYNENLVDEISTYNRLSLQITDYINYKLLDGMWVEVSRGSTGQVGFIGANGYAPLFITANHSIVAPDMTTIHNPIIIKDVLARYDLEAYNIIYKYNIVYSYNDEVFMINSNDKYYIKDNSLVPYSQHRISVLKKVGDWTSEAFDTIFNTEFNNDYDTTTYLYDEILYSNYDLYDLNKNLIFNSMEIPLDVEPSFSYREDFLEIDNLETRTPYTYQISYKNENGDYVPFKTISGTTNNEGKLKILNEEISYLKGMVIKLEQQLGEGQTLEPTVLDIEYNPIPTPDLTPIPDYEDLQTQELIDYLKSEQMQDSLYLVTYTTRWLPNDIQRVIAFALSLCVLILIIKLIK